jgi:hypothetical protein
LSSWLHEGGNGAALKNNSNGGNKMVIFNCTSHALTPEQKEGMEVIELPADLKAQWGQVTEESKEGLADDVVAIVTQALSGTGYGFGSMVLVQGHPGATYMVVSRLKGMPGIVPVYAESVRDSVEEKQSDGSVKKMSVFRHLGFREY